MFKDGRLVVVYAESCLSEAGVTLPPRPPAPPPPTTIDPDTPWIMWTHTLTRFEDQLSEIKGTPVPPSAPRAWTPDWEKPYQTRAGCDRAIQEKLAQYRRGMEMLGRAQVHVDIERRCARTPQALHPDGQRLPQWPANAPWGVDAQGTALPRLP